MVRNHQATLISLGLGWGNKKEIETIFFKVTYY